jgi:ABC-type nitrate/sulfonate/bicarbonate transport system permease component
MDLVLLGIFVVGAVGFGLNTAATGVERRALGWRANNDEKGATR